MKLDPVKKLLKNSLFKEFSFFGSSTLVYQISRVLVELAAAKILGPSLWGIWYLLNLVIAYRGVFELGITNGMNREVPINLGKNDEKKAENIENIAFTSVQLSAVFTSIILLAASFIVENTDLKNALLCLIPLFIVSQFYYLLNASLKAHSLFNYVSRKQFIFSFLFPLLAVPLTYKFKLEGFIVAFTLALFISGSYIYNVSPISYSIRFDWKEVKNLIRIGFPIMAVGIAYTFLNTADRWIIAVFLEPAELGYYSMAIIVFGGMTLFPRIISMQLYPRMAFDWGKSNSKEKLLHWTWLQTKYSIFLIIPLMGGVLVVFPWIIRTWLPEYIPGIFSLQIIVFGTIFMPFSVGWGNLLNIIDKQVYYLIIIVSAAILNIILNYILVQEGYGIEGVAFGTTLTFAIYNISIMVVGKYLLRKL
ncbi:MAG TPA: polysaccharide biosynthesis C-terminal domain-containing protein [Gracilimonas sp.]|nr:polysaccharide biosynthesis C-terminal domain-containing protein [Gracilimonas sp.]